MQVAHIGTYALAARAFLMSASFNHGFVNPGDDCRALVRDHPSGKATQRAWSGGMRRLRMAIRNRHSIGEQRASLAEYAVTIALVAVLVSASVLWLVTQFGG